ncbi:MAG: class I SAM-dependent methyltransferase, partial [Phycisphaerales bacterium]
EARIAEMGLKRQLENKTVLEIGCNTGFLAISIADRAKSVLGFDINPHLIDIARDAANYAGINNARFIASSFEDFSSPEPFDSVLSFASHATYDGNTGYSIDQYLRRCYELVKPGGLLLFESHSWEQPSSDDLQQVCFAMDRFFTVRQRQVLQRGRPADQCRTFIVGQRRTIPMGVRAVHEDSHSNTLVLSSI